MCMCVHVCVYSFLPSWWEAVFPFRGGRETKRNKKQWPLAVNTLWQQVGPTGEGHSGLGQRGERGWGPESMGQGGGAEPGIGGSGGSP